MADPSNPNNLLQRSIIAAATANMQQQFNFRPPPPPAPFPNQQVYYVPVVAPAGLPLPVVIHHPGVMQSLRQQFPFAHRLMQPPIPFPQQLPPAPPISQHAQQVNPGHVKQQMQFIQNNQVNKSRPNVHKNNGIERNHSVERHRSSDVPLDYISPPSHKGSDKRTNSHSQHSHPKRLKYSQQPNSSVTHPQQDNTPTNITTKEPRQNPYNTGEENTTVTAKKELKELHKKFANHISRLFEDGLVSEMVDDNIFYNGVQNVASFCGCSDEMKKTGTHHNVYQGQKQFSRCDPYSNNEDKLFHYTFSIKPDINFKFRKNTTVTIGNGEVFTFTGFSIFAHEKIDTTIPFVFFRHNIDYRVYFKEEKHFPKGLCNGDLDLISKYIFNDLFELNDWDYEGTESDCPPFHFMPRFTNLSNKLLTMAELMQHLIVSSSRPFLQGNFPYPQQKDWRLLSLENYGNLVLNPQKKPRCLRVDWIGGNPDNLSGSFEHITSSLKSKTDAKEYVSLTTKLRQLRRLIKNRAVPKKEDEDRLSKAQDELNTFLNKREKKWITVNVNAQGYLHTGLKCDVFQFTSLLPLIWKHVLFVTSFPSLEKRIQYTFNDKSYLKIALTQPSYLEHSLATCSLNNSLENLGKHITHASNKYGKPHNLGFRSKGAINIAHIMSQPHHKEEKRSSCLHNERLEFLGDALLEYICSVHLFLMFNEKGPGMLTKYRSLLVKDDSLAKIGKRIALIDFIQLQHRDHIMEHLDSYLSDCVEAIIGAVYLDGGLPACDKLLNLLLFAEQGDLKEIWRNSQKHPLQLENPDGDRHFIEKWPILQKLLQLEESTGIEFKHIRLLSTAFTHSVEGLPDPSLSYGTYQRMEFLGDSILKFLCSDYLYKHFPDHQEGHLTLLRMTLVNAKSLIKAAEQLSLKEYIVINPKHKSIEQMNKKVLSDVFEAFVGALHLDKGIRHCRKLVEVCLISKLKELIITQEWLDPKSQLQQCCNSLHDPTLKVAPELPEYRFMKSNLQNENGVFRVSVNFKERRLGTGEGRSKKEAEKAAARDALSSKFFELQHQQKRIVAKRFRNEKIGNSSRKRNQSYQSDSDSDIPRPTRHNTQTNNTNVGESEKSNSTNIGGSNNESNENVGEGVGGSNNTNVGENEKSNNANVSDSNKNVEEESSKSSENVGEGINSNKNVGENKTADVDEGNNSNNKNVGDSNDCGKNDKARGNINVAGGTTSNASQSACPTTSGNNSTDNSTNNRDYYTDDYIPGNNVG